MNSRGTGALGNPGAAAQLLAAKHTAPYNKVAGDWVQMVVVALKIHMDPDWVLRESGNNDSGGESLYFPLWMQNFQDLLLLSPVRVGLPAPLALAG